MAQRLKSMQGGRVRRAVLFPAHSPRDTERQRAEKRNATTAAQKALNAKNAREKLAMTISGNFSPNDYFVTLTYDDSSIPPTYKDAVSCIRSFRDQVRDSRKKQGQALQYIYVTEGHHGAGRFHHHVIISATGRGFAADKEELASLWRYGNMDISPLSVRHVHVAAPDVVDGGELAGYMLKEKAENVPVGAQSYTVSKNLKRPEIHSETVSSETTMQDIVPPGAIILERTSGQNQWARWEMVYFIEPASPKTGRKVHAKKRRSTSHSVAAKQSRRAGPTK